jgi:hypothetical protein
MGFFVGCKSGKRKRELGDKWAFVVDKLRYLWPEEPIQPLFKKLLPKRLED